MDENNNTDNKLLKLLQSGNLLSAEQVKQLINYMQEKSINAVEALIASQHLTTSKLAEYLSRQLNIKQVDIDQYDFFSLCRQLDVSDLMKRYLALPLTIHGQWLTLAVADPTSSLLQEDFQFVTGLNIDLVIGEATRLKSAIEQWEHHDRYRLNQISEQQLETYLPIDEPEDSTAEIDHHDAPVSQFIHQLLHHASQRNASDIHFEPYESSYRIRMRIDGLLLTTHTPPPLLSRRLASRIKVLANLNIAERRLPQDGRIKLSLEDRLEMDLRVSTLPTQWGEKIVIRLLNTHHVDLHIEQLGFSSHQQRRFTQALDSSQGMLLITGPTGSGKTVTLYSALKWLNDESRNISTVEDPIEITLSGINQTQTSDKIGLNFSQVLRALLRQDPDIIMIGEIRDLETATIAFRAAQTGHLVLSTLHANSAQETFTRLLQMGLEPYQIMPSLRLIVAQRLLRRLCPRCKITTYADTTLDSSWGISTTDLIYRASPDGCHACTHGYQGRIGIYEMLAPLDSTSCLGLSTDINKTPDLKPLGDVPYESLWVDAISKVRMGMTSLEEVLRVLSPPKSARKKR
jgi:type IV pilus assembly protein PilB